MSTFNTGLRSSTAAAALMVALSAPAAFAQAQVSTNLGVGETITTSATYAAGNTQKLVATPSATATTNNVNIDLTTSSTVDDIVTAATPTVDNLISASATGNSSTAGAVLLFAPSTAGDTAAVGTLQSVETDVVASSTGDTHSIVIENTDTGVRTFTGSALQDNNDITASATGNDATSSITVASGLDVDEAAAGQASLLIDESLTLSPNSLASADLLVSSSQEIDGADLPDIDLDVSSTVSNGATTVFVEALDGATVSVIESDQSTSATGNSATNSILSLDTTANITGSAAIANLQSIDPSEAVTISATTTGSTISVDAGDDSSANGGGGVANSTVSLADNTQSAAATGSTSTQTLTLDASSITGEGLSAVLSDSGSPTFRQSATGDAIIGNVQSIDPGVAVSASTTGNTITSDMAPTNGVDVTNSTLELDGNTQSASATGVSTTNALSLTSGATMSAAGAVGSGQVMDGIVSAEAAGNSINNLVNIEELTSSSMLTTNNTIQAVSTGTRASNTLSTTTATNNLSVADNTGAVQNGVANGANLPFVEAGQALANDQSSSGSVSAVATDNQVLTSIGSGDANSSTVTTDDNTLSASATAQTADNAITLSFNELTGAISGAGTGVVAGLANDQTLADNMTVTARNVGSGGIPVLTFIDSDAIGSSVSTSQNTVSVNARGNVTTGNDVVVDATNITSGSQAAPSITAATGAVTATGSFISASTQISGADILASQLDLAGTTSNTIETQFGDDIQDSSTVVSDANVLSASATANNASNAVQLGDADTATIAASGVVANYQGTTDEGSVSAEIGIEGNDSIPAFTSTNAAGTETGQLVSLGGGDYTNNGATLTFTFNDPLTPEEQAKLSAAGFQNIGSQTADFVSGTTIDSTGNVGLVFSDGLDGTENDGNETLLFGGFVGTAVPGELNGAGVIVRVDGTGDGQILDSTVSVSGNTVVGEVNGNIAANAASATATTVTGLEAAATSIVAGDLDVAPTNSDLAAASLQSNASALSSDVAATFAILAGDIEDDIQEVVNSTQTVSGNLQQSYATANRATNSVDLTATNTDADTALESVQISSASVATTSDMDVVANAGGTNSSLAMEGNQNQSVANGNVATSTTTLDVTNATATGTTNALIDGLGVLTGSANNALASNQLVTADVTASATTDVNNQDATRTGGNEIIDSSVSLSSNATIAQATGNNGSQTLALGDAGTANMERTGVLMNTQSVTATAVSSTVDQDVSVSLTNTATVPVQASSLSLDGNSTTALARSNVSTNTLNVDGANIATGDGSDAGFVETAGTLGGAYVLGSFQDNSAGVTATTSQSRVEIDLSNAAGNAIDNSTLSLSENASSATALANTAVNSVSVGANSANVDASAALGNVQANSGSVEAIGGSAVGVYADALGTDPNGINGSSVLVSGNASASNAVGNQAQNSLTASGTNISSGVTGVSASLDAATPNSVTASAGNLLLSDQANSGAITSTNTANVVTISSAVADGTGAAAEGSTLSVTGNTTEALATANLVVNSSISLGGASTTSADATGLIGNFQFNDASGAVTASASTSTTISLNGTGAAGALSNGSAMMQDNSTLALARGNVVENVLTANGANVGAGTSPASVSSTAPDAGVLSASYGVFNEQVQQAPINATSIGASYAINATSGTGTALNGASATVDGNSIAASAFGNVATNSVTLTSLNGTVNNASAAVYNGQINSGAITSLVSGAQIGTYSTGGVTSASVGVSGNSISASSVGNFATSTVTRANR